MSEAKSLQGFMKNVWTFSVAAMAFLQIDLGFAKTFDIKAGEEYQHNLSEKMRRAQDILDNVTRPNFANCAELAPGEAQECLKFYTEMKAKKKIRIDYFNGYFNAQGMAFDHFERRAIVEFLKESCSQYSPRPTCGFSQDPQDADLLTKEITWPDGTKKIVEFRVYSPSIGPNDVENKKNPKQNLKSQMIRKKFIEAAGASDVLFYSGHSRYGGGPDFFPERKTVAQYRQERRGLKDLKDGLSQRKSSPAMLILAGCDSDKHFHSALQQMPGRPRMAVLSTQPLYGIVETAPLIIQVADSILNGACPSAEEPDSAFKVRNYQQKM